MTLTTRQPRLLHRGDCVQKVAARAARVVHDGHGYARLKVPFDHATGAMALGLHTDDQSRYRGTPLEAHHRYRGHNGIGPDSRPGYGLGRGTQQEWAGNALATRYAPSGSRVTRRPSK